MRKHIKVQLPNKRPALENTAFIVFIAVLLAAIIILLTGCSHSNIPDTENVTPKLAGTWISNSDPETAVSYQAEADENFIEIYTISSSSLKSLSYEVEYDTPMKTNDGWSWSAQYYDSTGNLIHSELEYREGSLFFTDGRTDTLTIEMHKEEELD